MSDQIPETFGRRVADCRDRRGWTQKRLADASGLSVTFLSELENDRRSPGADALLRLADALGASLDYLVKGVVDMPTTPRPLIIPPALAEAAEEEQWTVGEAADLLKFRNMVVARRSRGGEIDDPDRSVTRDQWRELYLRFFGVNKDDAAH
jgi:transcriptional regulator with XRE-family HTH domain